jgi:LmbE family N-acetylglucosaminyl deacetylase
MTKKKLKILFLCAHPDDLEFMIPNIIIECVENGHDITVASMTRGEYGSLNPSMFGEKLARIRVIELNNAAKINGVKDVRFLGFIDGHVAYNKGNIMKLKKFLDSLRPDVIFCPEAYFTYYWHYDHVNTGKMVHYILRKYYAKKPALLFFHSYKNNFFVPVEYLRRSNKSLRAHFYTQFQIIGLMVPFRYLIMVINGLKIPCLFAEACRRVKFVKNENSFKDLKSRLLHTSFSILRPFQAPNERKD